MDQGIKIAVGKGKERNETKKTGIKRARERVQKVSYAML